MVNLNIPFYALILPLNKASCKLRVYFGLKLDIIKTHFFKCVLMDRPVGFEPTYHSIYTRNIG